MKKIIGRFLAISSIGLLMLTSCKKNDPIVTATSGKAGTLTATSTSITLSKANDTTSSAAVTFNFTAANYGYSAAITNTLEIDNAADNWAKPVSITLAANVKTYSYTTAQLNTLALGFKIGPDTAGQLLARVVHTISSTVTPIYSNVVTFTVTPYSTVIPATYLYVVGAYQGWSTSAADSLASFNNSKIYTGIINFTTGNNQFLILPAKSFSNKYATNDPTTQTPSTTAAYNAPNNFNAPTAAGNYLVTLDLNANTITFEAVNYYSVIGSSTPPLGNGFTVDNDMKYVNGDQAWEITTAMPETGGFKIRQNHAWTYSWGTLATPDGATLTDASGGNIPVNTVGTYKVTFKIAPSAVGATPPITAPYTLVQQ